jgi:WhiB family transcriptional regulator, redox-sensing transcriptional regulator
MWELAACAEMETETFFRSADEPANEEAKGVCRGCTVRGPCLEYAVRYEIDVGIWGGLTARERRALHRVARPRRSRSDSRRSSPTRGSSMR